MGEKKIKRGIRDDGTVEDRAVETRWLPIIAATVVPSNDDGEGFIRLTCDDGPTDVEIRVPLSLCRSAIEANTEGEHP